MSDDVVTRLRQIDNGFTCPCVFCEAVAEIERLRAEVKRLDTALQSVLTIVHEAVHGE